MYDTYFYCTHSYCTLLSHRSLTNDYTTPSITACGIAVFFDDDGVCCAVTVTIIPLGTAVRYRTRMRLEEDILHCFNNLIEKKAISQPCSELLQQTYEAQMSPCRSYSREYESPQILHRSGAPQILTMSR